MDTNVMLVGVGTVIVWTVIVVIYLRTTRQFGRLHDEIEALNRLLNKPKRK